MYPAFLKYYLESPFGQFLLKSRQLISSTNIINTPSFVTLPVHYLPYEEQVALVDKLVAQESAIYEKIANLKQEIDEVKQSFHKEIGIEYFSYDNERIVEERKTSAIAQLKRKKPYQSKKSQKTTQIKKSNDERS